jgi:cyclophilin family peptidyl-prolyl cis-trans isomerase
MKVTYSPLPASRLIAATLAAALVGVASCSSKSDCGHERHGSQVAPRDDAARAAKPSADGKDAAVPDAAKGGVTIDDGALPLVSIKTPRGTMVCELFEDDAPNTVANFVNLIEKGFYDGLTFHRVEPGFCIQGGDPAGNGTGGPGYFFDDEFSRRKHEGSGILSMANSGPGTNGSQFFVTLATTQWLDGKHSVFGRVIKGRDVPEKVRVGDKMECAVVRKRSHKYSPAILR